MGKPFELLFFVSVMVWIGSILLSDGPRQRIEMVCKPVEWSGRLASSVASIGSADAAKKTSRFFVDRNRDCQMIIFKQFYESRYRELTQIKAVEEAAKSGAGKAADELKK